MRRVVQAGLATCLMSSVQAVLAEDAPEGPDFLDEVLIEATASGKVDTYLSQAVTALKGSADLRDVPQAVTVVTRQLIDDQALRGLADAMRHVPGIGVAQGEGNREALVFRGSTSTADFLVDGLRDDVQYYRDLYNIAQIEALKGPNGLAFGRGGGGGMVNRATKQAGSTLREVSLQAASWQGWRASADIGQAQADHTPAWRLNGVWEDAGSYRQDVLLRRHGIAPALAYEPGEATRLTLQGEYFHDERTADRGVSAYNGRPLDTDPGLFFGDPQRSPTWATVQSLSASASHAFSAGLRLRNSTRLAHYDKFYQNLYPGAVNAAGTQVTLSAYNHATTRDSLLNQTDIAWHWIVGAVDHDLSAGLELGRQATDTLRLTGYFTGVSPNTTSVSVPVTAPRTSAAVSYRAAASDANNHSVATTTALYLQDRMHLGARWELVLGARVERFDVDFTDRRGTGLQLATRDTLVSPSAALVWKPLPTLSAYASTGSSRQPRAGEQFASLTSANAALAPESFNNRELGVKWDVTPVLQATLAAYHLQRRNVAITDPANPTLLVLTDGQRVQGLEASLSGTLLPGWRVMAAAAWQDGKLASDQSAVLRAGARLASLPPLTASVWNRFDLGPQWGLGLGLVWRDAQLAAVENLATPAANVVLPGFLRVDSGLYYNPMPRLRLQLNIENLLDRRYFASAHSSTNITPGAPRSARLSVTMNWQD